VVGLPVDQRGPQEPDQLPQAVLEAEAAGGKGQQQPAQLVQLPALLGLGAGGQGLLERLVDGVSAPAWVRSVQRRSGEDGTYIVTGMASEMGAAR
jgi:hypothetical protein